MENVYQKAPNFSVYKSLSKAPVFLNNFDNFFDFNYNDIKIMIKINSLKEFNNNKQNIELIKSISIKKQNFYNLNILSSVNLINLIRLHLDENNIDDLSPLIRAKFINLRHLSLSINKIGNRNIEYLSKFNFKELLTLDLYRNNLTDYNFFREIKNFPKLKQLMSGANTFKDIDNRNNQNFIYDCSTIKEIGLSNGVFTDKSIINLISHFKFDSLKLLYLSANNISSLKFIDNLNCPDLREIWLNRNKLKEFELLNKFKRIMKINLKDNYISKIDNIEKFVNSLKELKEFNLINNKDLEINESNKEIIKNVKKKINLLIDGDNNLSIKDINEYKIE